LTCAQRIVKTGMENDFVYPRKFLNYGKHIITNRLYGGGMSWVHFRTQGRPNKCECTKHYVSIFGFIESLSFLSLLFMKTLPVAKSVGDRLLNE
jgi:hypothetical protein